MEVCFRCELPESKDPSVIFKIDFGEDGPIETACAGSLCHQYLRPGTFQARCLAKDAKGNLVATRRLWIKIWEGD